MAELRLSCVVIGCKRTRGRRKGEPPVSGLEEWICGKHWSAMEHDLRRVATQTEIKLEMAA